MLTTTEQFIIGCWLSLAVFIGLTSQSMGAVAGVLLLGAFFVAPMAAQRASQASSPVVRFTGLGAIVLWLATIAFFVVMFIERLYYQNADTYPRWLATATVHKADMPQIDQACKGRGPIEARELSDSKTYLLRCGFMWYDAKTYLADFFPYYTPSEGSQK